MGKNKLKKSAKGIILCTVSAVLVIFCMVTTISLDYSNRKLDKTRDTHLLLSDYVEDLRRIDRAYS